MKQFWLDGRSSREFGMMITGAGTYNAPERDVEFISIEGRNGDLIIDNGRFKNVPLSYPISICRDFPEKAAAARAWLLSKSGYMRLEDDYDPEHFRLAAFTGPLDFDVKFLNRAAEATLNFNCKPQRFLKSGEIGLDFHESGMLHNPTAFPALPVIGISGDGPGTITVNGTSVEILRDGDYIIMLDCESQNATVFDVSMNHVIRAAEFPVLQPGDNEITFDGGVEYLLVAPRWWTL